MPQNDDLHDLQQPAQRQIAQRPNKTQLLKIRGRDADPTRQPEPADQNRVNAPTRLEPEEIAR
jgi:hypothetical protein